MREREPASDKDLGSERESERLSKTSSVIVSLLCRVFLHRHSCHEKNRGKMESEAAAAGPRASGSPTSIAAWLDRYRPVLRNLLKI